MDQEWHRNELSVRTFIFSQLDNIPNDRMRQASETEQIMQMWSSAQ